MSDWAMGLIERAAPYMDAYPTERTKWPPSTRLKILYCAIATGKGGDAFAEQFVVDHIERARELYRSGCYANPFAEPMLRELNNDAEGSSNG